MQDLNFIPGAWESYNNRKKMTGQDPNCFSPEELWEFDFLVNLIQKEKPHLDQITVMLAVREGMRRTMAPRLRDHFVNLVMNNISERENQWATLIESMGHGVNLTPASIRYPYVAN